jgi:pimeloyl-ACP methyl ester carboxylesterase
VTDPFLSHDRIAADGAEPVAWLYVLHGVYGAGRNWASVMRRLVRERPDWGVLLIDLRQHGESQGFSGPHTIQAAAADLERLAVHTGLKPDAVLGHSFGGKVALVFAGTATTPPRQVWVIDSTPQSRVPDGSAWDMLELLESLPRRFDSRNDLVEQLMERGQPKPLAQWLATNLVADDDAAEADEAAEAAEADEADDVAEAAEAAEAADAAEAAAPPGAAGNGAYRWRLDFDSIRELLISFFETDAWDVVESPPDGTEIHLVKAEDSRVLTGEPLERADRAAATGSRTFVHRIAGGHWVNAENPAAVESLLVQMLPVE